MDWSWVTKMNDKCPGVKDVVDILKKEHSSIQPGTVHKWLCTIVTANKKAQGTHRPIM